MEECGEVREEIVARGHPNVTALHKTTLEITKEKELTKKGDCIIGVDADKSISEISENIKDRLKKKGKAEITILLPDYGLEEKVKGIGSEKLTFSHPTDIVLRKSSFVCGRTLLIKADKAAIDVNREIIDLLKDPSTLLVFRIEV